MKPPEQQTDLLRYHARLIERRQMMSLRSNVVAGRPQNQDAINSNVDGYRAPPSSAQISPAELQDAIPSGNSSVYPPHEDQRYHETLVDMVLDSPAFSRTSASSENSPLRHIQLRRVMETLQEFERQNNMSLRGRQYPSASLSLFSSDPSGARRVSPNGNYTSTSSPISSSIVSIIDYYTDEEDNSGAPEDRENNLNTLNTAHTSARSSAEEADAGVLEDFVRRLATASENESGASFFHDELLSFLFQRNIFQRNNSREIPLIDAMMSFVNNPLTSSPLNCTCSCSSSESGENWTIYKCKCAQKKIGDIRKFHSRKKRGPPLR